MHIVTTNNIEAHDAGTAAAEAHQAWEIDKCLA